jgi:hypothetical protein
VLLEQRNEINNAKLLQHQRSYITQPAPASIASHPGTVTRAAHKMLMVVKERYKTDASPLIMYEMHTGLSTGHKTLSNLPAGQPHAQKGFQGWTWSAAAKTHHCHHPQQFV